MYAAITGDIINSKQLNKPQRDAILTIIQHEFEKLNQDNEFLFPLEFIRGDSFQCVHKNIGKALQTALVLKSIFKKQAVDINANEQLKTSRTLYKKLDIRLSVGIGEIEYLKDTLSLSDGTALRNSGKMLDLMKQKPIKTIVTTQHDTLNRELEVELKLLDVIIDKWTPMAAEVVYYLLHQLKETDIATRLKISQSAVNQRKQTANWDAVETLLKHFEYLVSTHLMQ